MVITLTISVNCFEIVTIPRDDDGLYARCELSDDDQIRNGQTRRGLLRAAAGTALCLSAAPALLRYAAAQSWSDGDPFSLGVASGDAVVPMDLCCWTRLAPEPLCHIRRRPGHAAAVRPVGYEIATDPAMTR